jgi:hypothetical protein
MPSIRQELETTRTARWYRQVSGAQCAGAWAERLRDYAALLAILDRHAAGTADGAARRHAQPPIHLPGLLKLVAEQGHYAGAEPVYRRYRHRHQGRPPQIPRLAGPDPAIRPAAAFLTEARVVTFWPYREGVIEVADAFDMSRAEWAAAYLRALAAWAAEDRPLAACQPAGPPACVLDDMTAIAGACTRWWAGFPAAPGHAERLCDLACDVVQSVLSDGSMTPLGAFNSVRHEVRSLLSPPPEPAAEQVLRSAAELSDRMLHPADGDVVVTQDQARRLRSMIDGLSVLLEGVSG